MSTANQYTTPKKTTSEYPDGTKNIAVASQKSDYLNPKLSPSGTLYVENIVEKGADGFGYEIDEQNDTYYFSKDLDANTEVRYVPRNVDKVYSTTVEYKSEIKSAFTVFNSEVKRFAIENMDRYKTSPKALKKKIDDVLKNKNQYIFTKNRNGFFWNQIYIDSTTLGPYNYDCKLHITEDVDFMNDLLVIRTGVNQSVTHTQSGNSYVSNSASKPKIAWVSPHDYLTYSGGPMYSLTGTSFNRQTLYTGTSGNLANYLSGALSWDREYHVSNAGQTYALSSKNYRLPKGQTISSGTYYYEFTSDAYDQSQRTVGDPNLQDFYYVYDEYQDSTNASGWDGVIPSGTWFTIESWSTNPRYIGFDGEITVKPTGASDPTLTVDYTCSATASDLDYQQSVRKAMKQAKKKFYKKVNKALVNAGIKAKSKRIEKYEQMLLRVAQNAYDGLSLVRNEHVAKVQGLEANPLGGPVYYDGTIRQYGGNKMKALYNTEETYLERISVSGSRGGTGSSVTSSSSSSSSSSGGGGGTGGSY